jgi:hypothetical protein
MTNTKTITFLDKEYTVPEWVNWIGRNADGTIVGYEYEPFELGNRFGYYADYGQYCVLFAPKCEQVLRRV